MYGGGARGFGGTMDITVRISHLPHFLIFIKTNKRHYFMFHTTEDSSKA